MQYITPLKHYFLMCTRYIIFNCYIFIQGKDGETGLPGETGPQGAQVGTSAINLCENKDMLTGFLYVDMVFLKNHCLLLIFVSPASKCVKNGRRIHEVIFCMSSFQFGKRLRSPKISSLTFFVPVFQQLQGAILKEIFLNFIIVNFLLLLF